MRSSEPLVDIHCHLLPGLDDGAKSWAESLEMGRIASGDGITTIIATPHQLGSFAHIRASQIRRLSEELQQFFEQHGLSLTVLPGADVRVQDDLVQRLRQGEVMTLGDHRKHVLLELPLGPHFALDTCLDGLARESITAILSHPERNQTLRRRPELLRAFVERGCLVQITAGNLLGAFGRRSQAVAEQIVRAGWAHLVASDAHGSKSRRPLMQRAFARVAELAGEQTAYELCCRNPVLVARGYEVLPRIHSQARSRTGWLASVLRLPAARRHAA